MPPGERAPQVRQRRPWLSARELDGAAHVRGHRSELIARALRGDRLELGAGRARRLVVAGADQDLDAGCQQRGAARGLRRLV